VQPRWPRGTPLRVRVAGRFTRELLDRRALAALLAVRALEDPTLPRPARLFLVSAAIGVSEFAALANIASTLSFIPYFEKAKWLDVLPEYDPYKYNSFTVNAGNQVFQLTRALHRELAPPRRRARSTGCPGSPHSSRWSTRR
jgi:hypothetical protein